jgi:transcriptional regulator with XRE-family HTH domain
VDTISQRLREERLRSGWSQKDLARESGTNVDTVSGIETGQHEPRPSTLRKLARALGIEVRDLFEERALAGKADAPATGRSLTDKALDAVRQDEEIDARAMARLNASEGVLRTTAASEYAEDAFRAELRGRPFDELYEDLILPLAQRAYRAEKLERAARIESMDDYKANVDQMMADEMAKRNVRQ